MAMLQSRDAGLGANRELASWSMVACGAVHVLSADAVRVPSVGDVRAAGRNLGLIAL